jgi:hypothetical protein
LNQYEQKQTGCLTKTSKAFGISFQEMSGDGFLQQSRRPMIEGIRERTTQALIEVNGGQVELSGKVVMEDGSGPVTGIVSGNSRVAHARPIRPGSFLEAETNFLLV